MYIKRIFYPVGHGGFSEEIFFDANCKKYSVVFDCGAGTIRMGENALSLRRNFYDYCSQDDIIYFSLS